MLNLPSQNSLSDRLASARNVYISGRRKKTEAAKNLGIPIYVGKEKEFITEDDIPRYYGSPSRIGNISSFLPSPDVTTMPINNISNLMPSQDNFLKYALIFFVTMILYKTLFK
jgi:hypothetical protein